MQTRQAFIVHISHDHDFSPVRYSTSTHRGGSTLRQDAQTGERTSCAVLPDK